MPLSIRFLLVVALVAFSTTSVFAQAPQLINFQAQVDNLSPTPTQVTFSIFNSESGGTALWSETQTITSSDGIIQVLLGSETLFPEDLFFLEGERYLELNISGETLSPRFQLTSVSYALRSTVADKINGDNVTTLNTLNGDITLREGANVTITEDGQDITIAAAISGGGGGGGITTVSGGSGIDVTNPNGPLAVVNVEEDALNDTHIQDNSLSASSLAEGSVESSELADETAVRNINGLTDDVTIAAGSNVTIGIEGQTITINAAGGGGGGGISTLLAGNGIAIDDTDGPTSTVSIAQDGVGSEELQNQIELGPSGDLVIEDDSGLPVANVTSGAGGGGVSITQADGNFLAGNLNVRSFNGSSLGGQLQLKGDPLWDAIHLFSDSETRGGRIVLREPNPNNGDINSSIIMTGRDGAGTIVLLNPNGLATSIGGSFQEMRTRGRVGIGLNQAEYDSDSPLGLELFVRGDAAFTGEVSNSANTSSMDHPLDPENMILNHSSVISSDQMTVYSGNVILNNQGEATVQLPDWFESLNTNFRYQLTPIGDWARLYIAEKVSNNQFRIAGGRNGLEVSWQITAVRNDPYALSNPVEVEETKAPDAQGTYLNPEAYGVSNNQ